MNHLVPCPGCERHVRVHEAKCPFCTAELDLSSTPAPILPTRRLGRAAVFAFGATLAAGMAASGCSSDDDGDGKGGAAGGGGSGAIGPAYGTPAGGSAGSGGDAGGTNTGGLAGAGAALYGATPGD